MAPTPINEDVLNGVDESRRDFLRKVIVGTVFATPLMASFSMDGLLINAAEAGCVLNDMSAPNMACFNTPYTGPSRFKARLKGPTAQGKATFKLTMDSKELAYKLRISNGDDNDDDNVIFQAACIFVPPWGAVVNLSEGRGVIDGGSVTTIFCFGSSSERFNTLLESMAEGLAEVRIQTNKGESKGQIVPFS